MSTPGPSHLLMLSNSMTHGFRPALATAAGDLSANTLQMLAAGFGLASLVFASETAFLVVKWGGVAYLVWMGLGKIRRAGRVPLAAGAEAPRVRRRALYMQGFITSAANPKAVVFFAALFPLFLRHDAPLAPQLLLLGATFVAIDGTFLCSYGGFAAWLARVLRAHWTVWLDRGAGLGLIAAAVLLGLKQVTRQA
jgi:threonine/homoserine/homoserine lactone efflux protein